MAEQVNLLITYLYLLLEPPAREGVLQDVGGDGDRGEDGSQHEVLGEQLALDEAKRAAGKMAKHRHSCKENYNGQ